MADSIISRRLFIGRAGMAVAALGVAGPFGDAIVCVKGSFGQNFGGGRKKKSPSAVAGFQPIGLFHSGTRGKPRQNH